MSDHLAAGYDLVVFDLDGVVYLIDKPIAGAAEAIERLRRAGTSVAYATNNASRRAADVAALLGGMGVPAEAGEVLTSAGAAAAMLAEKLPAGSNVLVVGAEALRAEVREAGLNPVETAEDEPAAVVQGYGPEVGWRVLAEAALAVRAGATWVATNTDRTLPSPRGPLPGNGSLVAVLRTALDRDPDLVVGKPEPALFSTAAARTGARHGLVVGDRLDTDIKGAVSAGLDSLLVLTGVSGPADLLAAPPSRRPTFVAADLSGLFRPADDSRLPAAPSATATEAAPSAAVNKAVTPAAVNKAVPPAGADEAAPSATTAQAAPPAGENRPAPPSARTAATVPPVAAGADEAGGWRVTRDAGIATLTGSGDPVVALRMLCAVTWEGVPVAGIKAGSRDAAALLSSWGL